LWLEKRARDEKLRWWSKKQWPGSSPDLSPIEGLWDILQQYVTPPGCMGLTEELHRARIDQWFLIDHSAVCKRALRGMPQRMRELNAAGFQAIGH